MNPVVTEPDFDTLGGEDVWELPHPSGRFGIDFYDDWLRLFHDESDDLGGMSFSEELPDEAVDRLITVLTRYREWSNAQRQPQAVRICPSGCPGNDDSSGCSWDCKHRNDTPGVTA